MAVRTRAVPMRPRTDPDMDPIHQFQVNNIFTFGRIGNVELAFTNSAAFMLIALAVILFLTLFWPSGVPIYVVPLVTFIEVLSFFARPVSHSVRLFANMLAGHITLKVFAGFVTMLGALGIVGWFGAVLPLALTVALFALE